MQGTNRAVLVVRSTCLTKAAANGVPISLSAPADLPLRTPIGDGFPESVIERLALKETVRYYKPQIYCAFLCIASIKAYL
jgi:hypothetical protein